ncbi:MAG: glycosyltransferase family 2 protein [Deltaproteobacteria bacterium]|nr:glycosyltransferase family 2 protein [Deltaproteobacteria bacterium]
MSCIAVVPAHRAAHTLAATLDSLLEDNGDFVERVIVVTSVADPTAQVARRWPRVELVAAPSALSAGAARNLGRLRAGQGADRLLFVDADCVLERGGAAALARELERRRVAAVSARVRRRGGGVVAWLRHALEFKEAEGRLPAPAAWLPPSTSMMCRAAAFDRAGGFPDLWPGEDLVFAHRLRSLGEKIVLSDAVETHHLHPGGFIGMLAHQRRLGHTAAVARSLTGMEGVTFVRHRWLVPLLAPARLVRALSWFARSSTRELLVLLALLPLYALGLAAWTIGFAGGARQCARTGQAPRVGSAREGRRGTRAWSRTGGMRRLGRAGAREERERSGACARTDAPPREAC